MFVHSSDSTEISQRMSICACAVRMAFYSIFLSSFFIAIRSNRNYNIHSTFSPIFILRTIFSQLDESFLFITIVYFLMPPQLLSIFLVQYESLPEYSPMIFTWYASIPTSVRVEILVSSSLCSVTFKHMYVFESKNIQNDPYLVFCIKWQKERKREWNRLEASKNCSMLNNDWNWLLAYIYTHAVLAHKARSHTVYIRKRYSMHTYMKKMQCSSAHWARPWLWTSPIITNYKAQQWAPLTTCTLSIAI